MKKTLALVLSVVMIMGLALTSGAAAVLDATSEFSWGVNATNTNLNKVLETDGDRNLGTSDSGSVIGMTFSLTAGGVALTSANDKDYKVTLSVTSGSDYVKDVKFDKANNTLYFSAINNSSNEVSYEFNLTIATTGSGSELLGSKTYKFKGKIKSSVASGTTYALDHAYGNVANAPAFNTTAKSLSLVAGKDPGEFGAIDAAVLKLLAGIEDAEIIISGSGYEFTLKKGTVGNISSLNTKLDILGSTSAVASDDAIAKANSDKNAKFMYKLADIASNNAYGEMKLMNLTTEFLDAWGRGTKTALVVYNLDGTKASNVTATWDGDNVILKGAIGSYVITGYTDLKASESGSGSGSGKPNPGTGK